MVDANQFPHSRINKNMNDGVKILLDRMKTHPEEFAVGEGVIGKWDSLIREYETILDLEDITLFRQARNKLLQQQFTESVLKELIDPKMLLTEEWDARYNYPNKIPTMPSISITPSLEQTLARLKEIKKECEPKPHKTIFGKLFNYS
jgi:hypothetical protein